MRKRLLIASVLAAPLLVVISAIAWLAVEAWKFEHRPGAVLAHNSETIRPGMTLEHVNSLLGMDGVEVTGSPIINDSAEPYDSPRRIRPAVSGESYYEWRVEDGSYLIVSLRGGAVAEKFLFLPSL
jgi:hypothetical protein